MHIILLSAEEDALMAQLIDADEAAERARREQAEWAAVLSMPQPERSVAVRRGVSRKTRRLCQRSNRLSQAYAGLRVETGVRYTKRRSAEAVVAVEAFRTGVTHFALEPRLPLSEKRRRNSTHLALSPDGGDRRGCKAQDD